MISVIFLSDPCLSLFHAALSSQLPFSFFFYIRNWLLIGCGSPDQRSARIPLSL